METKQYGESPKEFSTTDKAKNVCIRGIIEALKEHKINELKKLAEKMKMDFDDELYTQIENLKDSEISILTKFLLKWLRNPEVNVYQMPEHIRKIFNNFAKYKKYEKYKEHEKYIGPEKYVEYVNGLLSHNILDKKDRGELMRYSIKQKKIVVDYWVYDAIKKLEKSEIDKLKKYLKGWLKNPRIDISNLSPELSGIFCNLTRYKDAIKHRDFVEGLFTSLIFDRAIVIDSLNSGRNNKYKVVEPSDDDAKKYGSIGSYHFKIVASSGPGQFQGIVFRLKDGIYQIKVDDVNDKNKLSRYFEALGFNNN